MCKTFSSLTRAQVPDRFTSGIGVLHDYAGGAIHKAPPKGGGADDTDAAVGREWAVWPKIAALDWRPFRPLFYVLACILALALPAIATADPYDDPYTSDAMAIGSPVKATPLDVQQIRNTIVRVGDWALRNPFRFEPDNWTMAPLYEGLIDASLMTGDPKYLAAVVRAGQSLQYKLGSRTYHADGHAAGHAWLRIYMMDPKKNRNALRGIIDQFNQILANPITAKLSFTEKPPEGLRKTDRWTWADALYMSPPTFGLLAHITGDDRYLRFVDAEYEATLAALYDRDAHFFYRDGTYLDDRSPGGEKVFWARGNAWVYAGLALYLDPMRRDYPHRQTYVDLFKELSRSLRTAQQPDGLWYPNLADPQQVQTGETSASALFVFAMAWGLRQGLLDSQTYLPAVQRGWQGLLANIGPDGAVNYVQPPGELPKAINANSHAPYGTGAVLMAAAELMRLKGGEPKVAPVELLSQAESRASAAPELSIECEESCP